MGRKKIAECPVELKELIPLVNSLPEDVDQIVASLEERARSIKRWAFDENFTATTSAAIVRSGVDDRIAAYCLDLSRHSILEAFDNLLLANSIFRHCAAVYRKFPDWNNLTTDEQIEYQLNYQAVDLGVRRLCTAMSINSNGFVKPWKPKFLEIFEKSNIPFFRIRECVICPEARVFWAQKIGTQYCDRSQCKAIYAKDIERHHALTRKLKNLKIKLEKQRQTLKDAHPLVQTTLAMIADVENQIEIKERGKK